MQGIRSYLVLFQVHILFDKLFATFCQSCSKQRGGREAKASSDLLPIRNTPSQSQSQLGKPSSSLPSLLPRFPCCTIPAVILKMGARGVTNMAARLWQRCRQTKFINAQHSKLTCSARYVPLPSLSFPSLTLLSASSPAGLCCCSKVKVCLKAVNNLTTKYESVKWPEEGEGALEGSRDVGW